jgi:hypothetical protein
MLGIARSWRHVRAATFRLSSCSTCAIDACLFLRMCRFRYADGYVVHNLVFKEAGKPDREVVHYWFNSWLVSNFRTISLVQSFWALFLEACLMLVLGEGTI